MKAADIRRHEARLKFRERDHQPATLCTLTMTSNIEGTGVARYPVGICPVIVRADAKLTPCVKSESASTWVGTSGFSPRHSFG